MMANKTNLITPFPLPIISNTKWWKDVDINEAFKKGNNFRINAGASCNGPAIIDDKKENKNNKGNVVKKSKKSITSKDDKKGSKKISQK